MESQTRAILRLTKDLKELQENPLPNVGAAPLEENMLVWHVNIQGRSAPFDGVIFHLIMTFPETYPVQPPKIDLMTTLPHANVFPGKYGKQNHICLDMLEDGEFAKTSSENNNNNNSNNREYSGWSSSYTVSAILAQMTAFLMEDKLHYMTHKVTVEQATAHANAFKCATCSHKPKNPWPVPVNLKNIKPVKRVIKVPTIFFARKVVSQQEQQQSTSTTSTTTTSSSSTSYSSAAKNTSTTTTSDKTSQEETKPKAIINEWQVVSYKKKSESSNPYSTKKINTKNNTKSSPYKSQKSQPVPSPSSQKINKPTATAGSAPIKSTSTAVANDILNSSVHSMWSTVLHVEALQKRANEKKSSSIMGHQQQSSTTISKYLSEAEAKKLRKKKEKTFKKNLARNEKRKALKHGGSVVPSSTTTPSTEISKETSSAVAVESSLKPAEQQQQEAVAVAAPKVLVLGETPVKPTEKSSSSNDDNSDDGFSTVSKKKKEESVTFESAIPTKAIPDAYSSFLDDKKHYSIGNFEVIPYEILIEIFSFLKVADLAHVSETCKGLYKISQDGLLWRGIFSEYYPTKSLTPANMRDWKSLFFLEVNDIREELVCYHTRKNFEEDVLGIPLTFTINPRTQDVDYIYSTMDILSGEAFFHDKVRLTVWKEPFTHWLPLYINEDHFQRGLPLIKKTLMQLSPLTRSSTFVPQVALEVIPKMMNTMIVLLMDKGVHASQKALDGYFALHRLLLALLREFPVLQAMVDKRVSTFIRDPASRHKDEMSSLGNFLPLVSASSKFGWQHLGMIYLNENMDRNVIWIGKKYPGLALTNLEKGKGADHDRLTKSFEAIHVSLRLLMFHVYFLRLNHGKSLDQVAAEYDLYFGKPSHKASMKFQEQVKKILSIETWPAFFSAIGMKCPSPADLTDWLKDSVRNSKKKGYHNDRTNFSAIQQSGVSKILLKGESYTAAPTLKKIKLEQVWSYPTAHVIFLDASCIIYDWQDKWIGTADWSQNSAVGGAVTHSGDVIDHEKQSGTHTLYIHLPNLPATVKCLWFTISAYTTTLKEIKQPYIRFTDADLDMELCRYDLEAQQTGQNTAVLMCKVDRDTPTSNWKVTAVGTIGMGRASNYVPIRALIDEHNKKSKK